MDSPNSSHSAGGDLLDPFKSVHFYNGGENFIVNTQTGFYTFDSESLKLGEYYDFNSNIDSSFTLSQKNLPPHPSNANTYYVKKSSLVFHDSVNEKKLKAVQFSKSILDVKVLDQFILVLLEKELRVIDYSDLNKIVEFPANTDNLVFSGVSKDGVATVVFPHPSIEGTVCVERVRKAVDSDVVVNDRLEICAHKSSIRCAELNYDGTLLATCSQKGTVIRIYETETGKLLKEVRRGSKSVTMYSLSFSQDSRFLCCYSSSGTVHVFSLGSEEQKDNTFSSMYLLSYIGINYLSSEWSMLEGSIPGGDGKCAFAPNSHNRVNVVTNSGKYLKLKFDDEKKKEPEVEEHNIFDNMQPAIVSNRKRKAEKAMKMRPGTVPLLITRHESSQLGLLKKTSYLTPGNLTISELIANISERLDLTPDIKIRLSISEDRVLQSQELVKDVHEQFKDDDGFLYIKYQ